MQSVSLCITIFLMLLCNICCREHFHQAPEQYKLSPGWQEPGFWRPKWIVERIFDATEDQPAKRDRIYIKLKNDRTLKMFNYKTKPKFELFRPKLQQEKKKKLFETGDEEVLTLQEQWRRAKEAEEAEDDVDGTWWWQEQGQQGNVKIETREGSDGERIRHDIRCDWGKLDGYAAKFRKGKLFKYKMTDAGVPLGTYQVGSFTIKVNPHRPLVSKEFLAFQ